MLTNLLLNDVETFSCQGVAALQDHIPLKDHKEPSMPLGVMPYLFFLSPFSFLVADEAMLTAYILVFIFLQKGLVLTYQKEKGLVLIYVWFWL